MKGRNKKDPFKPAKGRKPYERQPRESDHCFVRFQEYRDMEPSERSHMAIARAHNSNAKVVGRMASQWGWRTRVEAWDMYKDELMRKEDIKAVKAMRRRHIKLAESMQGLGTMGLSHQFKKVKELLAQDKDIDLTVKDIIDTITAGVKLERNSRQEPDEIIETKETEKDSGLDKLSNEELMVLRDLKIKMSDAT